MRIDEIKGMVPNEIIDSLRERGLEYFTDPQEKAIKSGLLQGKNMVIASPTASGKTLAAELAMIRSVLSDRKKAVYVAPMRALVGEKYREFQSSYPYLRSAISIGNLDSADMWLSKYDMIFVSTEKFDSLIRHGIDWLDEIGCIVFDEIHMLGDGTRGPTLEILITRIRRVAKNVQILALSATIGNADEMEGWLGAKLVTSDYRSVRLEKGILSEGRAYYIDRTEDLEGSSKVPEIRITEDTLSRNKQILIFYATKRNAEAGAEKLKAAVKGSLNEYEKATLKTVAARVLNSLSKPTLQCEKLSKCIESGVAFHHSGLVNEQREIVEDAFRNNIIRAICATTTLGYGVNLPANTVLVRDITRYAGERGSEEIGINEVTQLFGRAGRPRYDTEGRAFLIARDMDEIQELSMKYMTSKLEPITSNLGILPVLRTHVLGFVATGFLRSSESVSSFLNESFYGYQYSKARHIARIVDRILAELEEWRFVEKEGSIYKATKIGSRISELYIDPLTGKSIIDALGKDRDTIANLLMITNTVEMKPYVRETVEAVDRLPAYLYIISGAAYDPHSYYEPEKPFSTALMLNDWMGEMSEPEIVKKYSTTPGALFSKITNADWLLYSAEELAKLLKIRHNDLLELRVRMRYGVREELMELVMLNGVGRVRARMMFGKGIRKLADLRKEDSAKTLDSLFGHDLTAKILEQVKTG